MGYGMTQPGAAMRVLANRIRMISDECAKQGKTAGTIKEKTGGTSMGYEMTQRDCKILIKKENFTLALTAINKYSKELPHTEYSSPPIYPSLEEALNDLDWEPEFNSNGDIVSLLFTSDRIGDEDIWMDRIAQFVDPGSWIEMEGEDSTFWRWYFNGLTCRPYYGEVVFPGIPKDRATISAFDDNPNHMSRIPIQD